MTILFKLGIQRFSKSMYFEILLICTYTFLLVVIYIFGDSESSFWFEDELVGIGFL